MKKGLIVMFAMTLAFTFMFVGAPAVEAMDTSTEDNVVQSGPGPYRIYDTVYIPNATSNLYFYEAVYPGMGLYRGWLNHIGNGWYAGHLFLYPHPYPEPW